MGPRCWSRCGRMLCCWGRALCRRGHAGVRLRACVCAGKAAWGSLHRCNDSGPLLCLRLCCRADSVDSSRGGYEPQPRRRRGSSGTGTDEWQWDAGSLNAVLSE